MPQGDRLHLLRLCLAGVAHGHNSASCDLLRPLVEHDDARIAVLATETIGEYKTDALFFPALLVDALHSEQPAVVETALRFAAVARIRAARLVQQALRSILKQAEPLSLGCRHRSCATSTIQPHWLYVLEQTQSKDSGRARTAYNWIGDSSGRGQTASAALVEKLSPLLRPKMPSSGA
jgi:hypothetical protein